MARGALALVVVALAVSACQSRRLPDALRPDASSRGDLLPCDPPPNEAIADECRRNRDLVRELLPTERTKSDAGVLPGGPQPSAEAPLGPPSRTGSRVELEPGLFYVAQAGPTAGGGTRYLARAGGASSGCAFESCSGRPGVPASGRAPPQGSACRSYSPSLAPNLSDARSRTALTFSLPWARDWDSSVLCPGLHQSRGSRLRLPSWEQASLKQLSTPRLVAAFLRLLRDLGPSPSSSWRTTRARSS